MKKLFYLAIIALATVFTGCESENSSSDNSYDSNSKYCWQCDFEYSDGRITTSYYYGTYEDASADAKYVLDYSYIIGYHLTKAPSDSYCY